MIAIFLIFVFTIYMICFFPYEPKAKPTNIHSPKFKMQMNKLWAVARTSMKTSKNAQAERALLSILKFDETNAAAYNRLGILYAKSQKFDEAIECFEIAQSLDDNPASLHNVGLIYLETGSFEKAAIAFEQALEIEGDIPTRYIALAKSYEQLGRRKDALNALESAFELDHSVTTLRQILMIHEDAGDQEAIIETTARIEKQLKENAMKRAEKIKKQQRKATPAKSKQQAVKCTPRKIIRRGVTTTSKRTANRTITAPKKPVRKNVAAKRITTTKTPAKRKIRRRKIIS